MITEMNILFTAQLEPSCDLRLVRVNTSYLFDSIEHLLLFFLLNSIECRKGGSEVEAVACTSQFALIIYVYSSDTTISRRNKSQRSHLNIRTSKPSANAVR